MNSGTKEGPLSYSGLEQAVPSNSLWVGRFSEYFANYLGELPWDSTFACWEIEL